MEIDNHFAPLFINPNLGVKILVPVIEFPVGEILLQRDDLFSVFPKLFRRFPLVFLGIRVDGG